MIGNFKYWKDGKPVTPNTGLVEFKYWKDGKPFLVYESGAGPTDFMAGIYYRFLMAGM